MQGAKLNPPPDPEPWPASHDPDGPIRLWAVRIYLLVLLALIGVKFVRVFRQGSPLRRSPLRSLLQPRLLPGDDRDPGDDHRRREKCARGDGSRRTSQPRKTATIGLT